MLLTVREGQVWLTRAGDAEDHVLAAGERLAVAAGEPLYVEPWRRGEAVRLSWQALPAATPVALPVLRTAMAQGLRRVADGLRDAARRVDVPPPACPAA
jgi:hypothetical protein